MKNVQLNNKAYEVLKWAAIIAFPAIGFFYVTIAQIWNLPYGEAIAQTLDAIGLLIGALLGISSKNFYSGMTESGEDE